MKLDELCMVMYDYLDNGALKIESKKDMKKRGVSSPNKADALTYTFVNEVTGVEGVVSNFSDKAQEIDMTTPSAFLG